MNLAAIIDPHPDDAVALLSRGRTTTYGELREQVAAMRGGLVAGGLKPGDRVALVAPNNWFFVVSYLAALGAGAVVVPLNPMAPAKELERELAVVGARIAVVGPSGREAFAGVDRRLIEASWCLGVSRLRTFLRIAFPLSWAGILTGVILSFAHTLGEFGVVLMVGGNIPGVTRTVSISIYDEVQAVNYSKAGMTSLVLLASSFLALSVTQLVNRKTL